MILDLDMRRHKLTPEALDSQSLQTLNEFHCVQDVSSPTSQYVPCLNQAYKEGGCRLNLLA